MAFISHIMKTQVAGPQSTTMAISKTCATTRDRKIEPRHAENGAFVMMMMPSKVEEDSFNTLTNKDYSDMIKEFLRI